MPVANGSSSSAATWQDKPELDIRDWGTVAVDGSASVATALQATLTQAAAVAQSNGASTVGASVKLPAGLLVLDKKILIPKGIGIRGTGWRNTVFNVAAGSFPDNCVFEPQFVDGTQEFIGLENFSLYGANGSSIPSVNQPNAGTAGTVAITIANPEQTTSFTLTANTIGVHTSLADAGYASNGTLTVGTKRVIYQGLSGWTFTGCYVINGYGAAISAGDAIAAVTTDNVRGVHVLGQGFPTTLRELMIYGFTGECLLEVWSNCVDYHKLWLQSSNRDCGLLTGATGQSWLSKIIAQSPGVSEVGTFAALHLQGASAQLAYQGGYSVDGLYTELSAHNTIGLWIDNIGDISVDTFRLLGGTNVGGTSYASQVGIQIDSTQASPDTADGVHTANISIKNHRTFQTGRTPLKDNVARPSRGGGVFALPANATATSASTTDFSTNPVEGDSDAIARLWRGTLNALTLLPAEILGTTANNATVTSGTQIGRSVPLLAGKSYGHVVYKVGSTAATFAVNNDGHWYFAVYDSTGTLVTQTADQGIAVFSGGPKALALNTPVVPAVSAMYTVVLMLYLGTGGGGVGPNLAATAAAGLAALITGMPATSVTANAGQTTGVAPGTLGATGAANAVPFIGLYT